MRCAVTAKVAYDTLSLPSLRLKSPKYISTYYDSYSSSPSVGASASSAFLVVRSNSPSAPAVHLPLLATPSANLLLTHLDWQRGDDDVL